MKIKKALTISAMGIRLRNAQVSDAAFILSLRTNTLLNQHISQVSGTLKQQVDFLHRYNSNEGEAFFIIEDETGVPLGTVRLYDQQGSSFSWGSWIVSPNAPARTGTRSALLVYAYGFDCLHFEESHFDVRQANKRVWNFHENWGAELIYETSLDRFYCLPKDAWPLLKTRYRTLFDPEALNVIMV